jgi:hypothetical protein
MLLLLILPTKFQDTAIMKPIKKAGQHVQMEATQAGLLMKLLTLILPQETVNTNMLAHTLAIGLILQELAKAILALIPLTLLTPLTLQADLGLLTLQILQEAGAQAGLQAIKSLLIHI